MAGLPDVAISVGSVSNNNGTLSATKTAQGDSGFTCQRALTVADNVAIDVGICRPNRSAPRPAPRLISHIRSPPKCPPRNGGHHT